MVSGAGCFKMWRSKMTERRVKYHAVNDQWPDTMPPLTGPEAITAAKRLYRFTMKKPWRGKWKLVSGNRYTRAHQGIFCVNPNYTGRGAINGWHDLVHFMSHYCHQRLWPNHRPHGPNHHHIEKEMVAYVLAHGWLDGRLRPKLKVVKSDPAMKVARLDAAAKRWTTKLRRATTAMRKIARQRARLVRTMTVEGSTQ
jgi:hypothetical protein